MLRSHEMEPQQEEDHVVSDMHSVMDRRSDDVGGKWVFREWVAMGKQRLFHEWVVVGIERSIGWDIVGKQRSIRWDIVGIERDFECFGFDEGLLRSCVFAG